MDGSSGGDCIRLIISRRSASACSSERIFIRARCPYASTYLELNSSSWWAILRVITVDSADVIAIRKINPRAMPRMRFRIVGCSMEWCSGVADGARRTTGRSGFGRARCLARGAGFGTFPAERQLTRAGLSGIEYGIPYSELDL